MSEQCPNECGELTQSRRKDVEFSDIDNDIYVTIILVWCPKCGYKHDIYFE